MKKHLIIGNPISHSLSPMIHNYWFKQYNINGNYEKFAPKKNELESFIRDVKEKKIYGMNVTIPYKQAVIPFLETFSEIAKKTNSVNTIYSKDGKIHGDNTDVYGFEKSIINSNLIIKDKTVLIFGAGGVVPSIIQGLKNLKVGKIYLSNRTIENAEKIKKKFDYIEILEWGEIKESDLFINSTSVGLKEGEKFEFNYNFLKEAKIFYDLIYNPVKTAFLIDAEKLGHKIINGRDMFLYQAQKAFSLWHNIVPEIDKKLINHLYND